MTNGFIIIGRLAALGGAVSAMLLAGCGGGGGGNGGVHISDPVPPGFKVLDTASGGVASYDSSYDPATAPASAIVFREIRRGDSVTLGAAPDEPGATPDEAAHTVTVERFFLAIHEITRAQWIALGGHLVAVDPPLVVTGAQSTRGVSGVSGAVPAYGVSFLDATGTLASFNAAHPGFSLQLPSNDQWEFACRAGQAAIDPWGADESAAASYAWVRETAGTVLPPGQRRANALGIYDMQGSVWEWASDGANPAGEHVIRGGSWNDNLISARAANRQYVADDVPYATAGVRLVLAQ